ncbi:MAG: hypothetical protein H6839_17905 [Planctomycetes bacterium]|nr:hypothetical protein [Planctomycetota bacterium]
MKSLLLGVTLLSLIIAALPLSATTLSVVPLSDSLKNPVLAEGDRTSEGYWAAVNAVRDQMLNRPPEFPPPGVDEKGQPKAPELDEEQARFCNRLSNLAKYRDTRVGRLFFGALSATPAIENLPDTAEFAAVNTTWPLALGSIIRVRVEWSRHDGEWSISALEVTLDGVAAAPITGMAPYFGNGDLREELLDFEPIDYLVGRSPSDREKPESERPAFDYPAAVTKLFAGEAGAFETTLSELQKTVNSGVSREARLAALRPHLSKEEFEAAEAADEDPERRDAFWSNVYEQIDGALKAPRPASVPEGKGAEVKLRYRLTEDGGTAEGTISALRLQNGKIAPRGERSSGKDTPDGNEGDSSGN